MQSYPEVLKNNIDEIREGQVNYLHPFINLANPEGVAVNVHKALTAQGISVNLTEVQAAVQHGFEEMDKFKEDLRLKAEELLMQSI